MEEEAISFPVDTVPSPMMMILGATASRNLYKSATIAARPTISAASAVQAK
jgi:hypothetical protein